MESALLTALGAAVGLLLAAWGTAALVAALPAGFESTGAMLHFRVSSSMLAFTTAVCALCVMTCGLGPALRATRGDLASWLAERAGSPGSRHVGAGRVLVVAQVAFTLLLVTGATLCVATLRNLRAVDPGFASDHLVMMSVETRGTALERGGIVPIHGDILERASRVPGVRAVGMATRVPSYGGRTVTVDVRVTGLSGAPREIELTAMTPGYLRTAGTRLLAGRDVATTDVATSEHVAVVNEAFARDLLGGASPLGRTAHLDGPDSGTVTIVGVAQDVRFGDRRTRQDPMLYVPVTQSGDWPFLVLAARTRGEPHQVVAALRDAVRAAAPLARASRWQTMDEAFDEALLRERLVASLGAGFAALALALATVGLAGVVGYGVARRVREIGVRMALGAHRTGIVWLVLRESLSMVALGVALAAPLALVVGRAMGALLFGVAPADLRVLLGAARSRCSPQARRRRRSPRGARRACTLRRHSARTDRKGACCCAIYRKDETQRTSTTQHVVVVDVLCVLCVLCGRSTSNVSDALEQSQDLPLHSVVRRCSAPRTTRRRGTPSRARVPPRRRGRTPCARRARPGRAGASARRAHRRASPRCPAFNDAHAGHRAGRSACGYVRRPPPAATRRRASAPRARPACAR